MPTNIISTIAPWLSVDDSVKAIAFYQRAFGAVEVYRLQPPEGGPVARLSVDGAEFWLSEDTSGSSSHDSESRPPVAVRMILTVTDPDALFAQAIGAGASQVFAVGEEHGWRLGRLADPFGHHWEIGRPLNS